MFSRSAAQEASTHDVASQDDYVLHRILHGVPEGVDDIPPMQAFPMDSNMDIMGGRMCCLPDRPFDVTQCYTQSTFGRAAMLAKSSLYVRTTPANSASAFCL